MKGKQRKYSDAHTHLTDPIFGDSLQSQEIHEVLRQARQEKVAYVVAQIVGRWRGTTAEEIGAVTTKNLSGLLGI
ncbi:hypothetical protein ACFL0M_04525 [Thermodesulfobacteriota bacterium]